MTSKVYNKQIGGSHYKNMVVQPSEFINKNKLQFAEGNAIKYICRAGFKDSKIQDLEKAIHYLQNELHHEKDIYFRASQGIPYQIQPDERDGSYQTLISEKSDC